MSQVLLNVAYLSLFSLRVFVFLVELFFFFVFFTCHCVLLNVYLINIQILLTFICSVLSKKTLYES